MPWSPGISCARSNLVTFPSSLPLQVSTHFTQMYAEPSTAEQCSHNAVIFVQALHDIMIDYDCQVINKSNCYIAYQKVMHTTVSSTCTCTCISLSSPQPNDLCSPNPVYMILFCGYLYRRLPAYTPKSTVSFQGSAPRDLLAEGGWTTCSQLLTYDICTSSQHLMTPCIVTCSLLAHTKPHNSLSSLFTICLFSFTATDLEMFRPTFPEVAYVQRV